MNINKLHDTHLHLDLIENLSNLIQELNEFDINVIAVTNLPPLFLKLIDRNYSDNIKPALGFHPKLLMEYKKYIPNMWKILQIPIYIGEVGLDIQSVTHEERRVQMVFFIELLERCHQIGGKIISVHSKGSDNEVLSIIPQNFNCKIIMHWYSGSLSNIYPFLEKGCYFSINFAMANSINGKKIIKMIPIEKILLESDSPFVKFDGEKTYHPRNLIKLCQKISDIKKIPLTDFEKYMYENYLSLHSAI